MKETNISASFRSAFRRYFIIGLVVMTVLAFTLVAEPVISSKPISEGDIAPVFSVQDLGGITRDLEAHIGSDVVMLDFWSIYCVSCVQALPKLIEIYEKYREKGFMLYGIDLDSFSVRRVQRFIKGLGFDITYPVIVDRKREVAGAYNVSILPTTILIGRDGKVEMFHIGYKPGDEEDFEHRIKKLID